MESQGKWKGRCRTSISTIFPMPTSCSKGSLISGYLGTARKGAILAAKAVETHEAVSYRLRYASASTAHDWSSSAYSLVAFSALMT